MKISHRGCSFASQVLARAWGLGSELDVQRLVISRCPQVSPQSCNWHALQVYFDFMHSAALSGATTSPDGFKYAGFKVTQKV